MSEKEGSENASEEGSMSDPSVPSAPPWIQKGLVLYVVDGNKSFPYTATAKSDPVFDNNSWEVQVQFVVAGTVQVVDCSKCAPIVCERRRQAHMKARLKIEESEAPKPRKVRVSKVIDLTGELDHSLHPADLKRPRRLSETKKQVSASDGDTTPRASDDDTPLRLNSLLFAPEDDLLVSPVAAMPPRDLDDDASSDSLFGHVSPSPWKRTRNGSAGEISISSPSEEQFPMAESDDVSENDKKPAAREGSDLPYERAKEELVVLCPSHSPEEIEAALHAIGPPYTHHNIAVSDLRNRRAAKEHLGNRAWKPFQVVVGMEIRKSFDGAEYTGFVTAEVENLVLRGGKLVKVWKVDYEDGDREELEEHELLRCRFPPPNIALCRGRAFNCLEIFCGTGVVSQEFRQLQWNVTSIDVAEGSNATLKKNILHVKPEELPDVPDFIWASLPCETYSRLAMGKHRNVKTGEYEKTEKAKQHNSLFTKMVEIMYWAKMKHPHLIVVIEYPVGLLRNMPFMKQFEEDFGLHNTTVDYCTMGRSEKKPTMIWTNDVVLSSRLTYFQCKTRCLMGGVGRHESVQDNKQNDYSVIPEPLAAEVAEHVQGKFVLELIRRKKTAPPGR